jgi:Ca2+-binding RTX toxin-like protein
MATIKGTNWWDFLQGTDGNDDIYGYGGPDTIWAGLGNDYIEPGAGEDTIYGGGGNDTISYLDYVAEEDGGNLAIPPDKLWFTPGVHVDLAAGEATMTVGYYKPEEDSWAGPFHNHWSGYWWAHRSLFQHRECRWLELRRFSLG